MGSRPSGRLPATAGRRRARGRARGGTYRSGRPRRPVLDLDDRPVVEVEQHVEGDATCLRDGLGLGRCTRAGDVAEEVATCASRRGRTAPGPRRAMRANTSLSALAHARLRDCANWPPWTLREQVARGRRAARGTARAGSARSRSARSRTSRLPSSPLRSSARRNSVKRASMSASCSATAGGRVVVGPRVGDAAAEHLAVLVEQHRLGGGRAEVDADEASSWYPRHAAGRPLARLCSIIWK